MSCKTQEESKGPEDSGCYDPLASKVTPAGNSDTKHERNADKNRHLPGMLAPVRKYIAKNKFIIAAVVIIALIIIIIIILSVPVKKTEIYLPCPLLETQSVACPDFWVGYRGKCFYTSKEERNWSLSLKTCSSLNASLAVIDTQNELDFWVHIFRPFHYWFGLSREANQAWKWSNGTEFKNRFLVGGEGFCAYINGKGADSTMCSIEKHFLCSRPESCRITQPHPRKELLP